MKDTDKLMLHGQLTALSAQCSAFKSMLSVPPPPVMAGVNLVNIAPALAHLSAAVKMQGEIIEKLIKQLSDTISKS